MAVKRLKSANSGWLPAGAAVFAAGALLAAGQVGAQETANAPKKPAASWVKLCHQVKLKADGEKKKLCITQHERIHPQTGQVVLSAGVRKVEGQKKERFLVMVPLGMILAPGIQVLIDGRKTPIKLAYSLCHAGGCTAETDASPEIIAALKKGRGFAVGAMSAIGKQITFDVPLTGFTRAYKGAPVDSKKYAQALRNVMMSIRKRNIEENRKARALAEKIKKEKAAAGAE